MIKSIQLTIFFSFKEETINLHQQTNLLVGINGSGKSNLFKALELLKVGVTGNGAAALQHLIIAKYGGFDSVYCKANDEQERRIKLKFVFDKDTMSNYSAYEFLEDIHYEIELTKEASTNSYAIRERLYQGNFEYIYSNYTDGHALEYSSKGHAANYEIKKTPRELILAKISDLDEDRFLPQLTIKRAISELLIYSHFDTSFDSQLRRPIIATSSKKTLSQDGSNLAQIINLIKIKYKKAYKMLTEAMNDVNPHFKGFDFNMLGAGTIELLLDEGELNSAVHIAHISDGTLRHLCLLAILLNPNRGKLICLDEPEMSLHPDMIHGLARLIKDIAREQNTTFIIATHSPHLLDKFHLENVRVFEKYEDNISRVEEYNEDEFAGWYDYFNVGEMWRSGDIGGKRW
ncbi:MAG: AAA family ATPase [Bacteroidota bacterium]